MDNPENKNIYLTTSTSKNSANVDSIIIEETTTTRKTLETKIVHHEKNPAACVEITLIHERLHQDDSAPPEIRNLSKLKAGEWTCCNFNSTTTLAIFEELKKIYAIAEKHGVPKGEKKLAVIELQSQQDEATIIKLLKECRNSPEISTQLANQLPDLVNHAQKIINLNKQNDGLARFKVMLKEKCTEPEWQNFFNEHDWILGGILDVQILGKIQSQPHLKGANVDGFGGKKGDFLLSTKGSAKFSVIVEIKTPRTTLLMDRPYREGIFSPSTDLNGGMAQLRSYLKKWELESSRTEDNRDILEQKGIYTIQPRGVLIIGHLDQVKNDRTKRRDFELFRQNQKDVHIVTFDEVYHRAKFILERNGV